MMITKKAALLVAAMTLLPALSHGAMTPERREEVRKIRTDLKAEIKAIKSKAKTDSAGAQSAEAKKELRAKMKADIKAARANAKTKAGEKAPN